MASKKTELNHAECIERDLAEWKKIFSLSGRAYGLRINSYKGKQKLVYIPDVINGSMVSFISSFPGDCAVICNKRLWAKFSYRNKAYSAVEYLKHPESFPEDCSGHVQSFIRNNVKAVVNLMLKEDDAEAFAAYLDSKGRDFSLEEIDELLEASKEAENIRPILINWKRDHFSPERQEKLQKIQEEREFGIRPPTVGDLKKLWDWTKLEDKSLRLEKYKGEEFNPVIPNKIGRSRVSEIGGGIFAEHPTLTDVTIPEGITSIGWRAFWNCRGLKTAVIPKSVTCIGGNAFQNCDQLTDIVLPEREIQLGEGAFYGCSALPRKDGMLIIGKKLIQYFGDEDK